MTPFDDDCLDTDPKRKNRMTNIESMRDRERAQQEAARAAEFAEADRKHAEAQRAHEEQLLEISRQEAIDKIERDRATDEFDRKVLALLTELTDSVHYSHGAATVLARSFARCRSVLGDRVFQIVETAGYSAVRYVSNVEPF